MILTSHYCSPVAIFLVRVVVVAAVAVAVAVAVASVLFRYPNFLLFI